MRARQVPGICVVSLGILLSGQPTRQVDAVEYGPGIMFSTLLENVDFVAEMGQFSIGNQLQGVFIPEGAKGTIRLSKADGTGLYEWDWTEELVKKPYSLLSLDSRIRPLPAGEVVYSQVDLKTAGDYVLDFFVEGKQFFTFPFSVSISKPDDPFLGGELYFLEGAWSDWGYMYMYNADPEQNLTWKIWLRHRQHDEATKYHDLELAVTRDKDGKLMCVSRENTSHNLPRVWTRVAMDLVNPPVKTSGGEYFKAKDLLATDGGYTLEMKVDGKPYGTWKMEVADGKFVHKGRTLRGEADPLTFVEGGRDAWWYEKEKGATSAKGKGKDKDEPAGKKNKKKSKKDK